MRRRWSTIGAAVVAALVLAGCSGSDDPPAAESAEPTPLARIDVGTVRLARAEFCDRLPDSAVRRALGGDPESDDSWGNGDPVPGDNGSGEVAHEMGCAWTGPGGTHARAWVFGRPVAAAFASTLVRQAGRQKGCSSDPAPIFGTPALLQTCTLAGGVQRVRRAGLFGDTWLTCEVSAATSSRPEQRLDAWCSSVVAALDTAG